MFLLCCACETKAAFATGPSGPPVVALCYASPPWLVGEHCSKQALESEGGFCFVASGSGPDVEGDLRSLGEEASRGGIFGLAVMLVCISFLCWCVAVCCRVGHCSPCFFLLPARRCGSSRATGCRFFSSQMFWMEASAFQKRVCAGRVRS